MQRLAWALVAILALAAGANSRASAEETCTSYLEGQREKMLAAALACDGTPSDAASARRQVDVERAGQKIFLASECDRPVSIVGQRDLFRECMRTHLCAAQTYTCALNHSDARSSIKECGQAMTACKLSDPIPQAGPAPTTRSQ